MENSWSVQGQLRHSKAWDWTKHLSSVKLVAVLLLSVS